MASRRLTLSVRVSPGSSRQGIAAAGDGTYRVRLRSRPIENRANVELVALLAGEFRVPGSSVRILSGGRGRSKVVEISGPREIPSWYEDDPR